MYVLPCFYTHICIYAYMYVYMHKHIYVYTCICTYMYPYTHVFYVCMHIYTCAYMYTYMCEFHPLENEYKFFFNVHGIFSLIEHILCHKNNSIKSRRYILPSTILSDHETLKGEVNYKNK